MKYTIVQFLSLRELVEAVNVYLEEGYRPLGGMRTVAQRESVGDTSIDTIAYHQTLVLEDPEKNTDWIDEILFKDIYRKVQDERDRQGGIMSEDRIIIEARCTECGSSAYATDTTEPGEDYLWKCRNTECPNHQGENAGDQYDPEWIEIPPSERDVQMAWMKKELPKLASEFNKAFPKAGKGNSITSFLIQ